MKKRLFCTILLLSVFIITYSYAQTAKIEICAAKSEPSRAATPDGAKKISFAKPVIKNVTVRQEAKYLVWVATIENTGTAPTSGQETVQCYWYTGSGNSQRPAGGAGVPAINPGQTKEVSSTLSPDPKNGNYSFELVSKEGKVLEKRPFGLGTPTLEVGQIKAADDRLAWEAIVKNTWLYGVRDVRVQAFKKSASQKDWEPIGESHLDFLQGGTSSTVKGKGSSAGADEVKVAVFLRRAQAEPWVEMVSKTLNLKK
jgi:hypothetical protein